MEKKIWTKRGQYFKLRDKDVQLKELPAGIYFPLETNEGIFLVEGPKEFSFDYKIYGAETDLVNRIGKTFNATTGNLGVLLNGVKGTGKTVTAKLICNALGLPVISMSQKINLVDFTNLLKDIDQHVVLFFDEFEKVYGESAGSQLLTVMDGVYNSEYRRIFLLTTNEIRVNPNMIERPGRIRYVKTFGDLPLKVIMELVDDILIHKHHRQACIDFISELNIITIDIVKAVLQEVNIHDEAPETFAHIFNAQKPDIMYSAQLIQGGKVLNNYFSLRREEMCLLPISRYTPGTWVRIEYESVGQFVSAINDNEFIVSAQDENGETVKRIIRFREIRLKHKSFREPEEKPEQKFETSVGDDINDVAKAILKGE